MTRRLRWYDYITINIFFLALTVLSQTNGLVFPLLVQNFVGEATKGTRLGELRLWTLMAALLWQALMGMLSDRNTSNIGRRRPFIFVGAIAALIFTVLTGLSAGMAGMAGFWFLFVIAILQSLSMNTAHGAEQGLIPDNVPDEKRGRVSAVKAILEVPIPLILVSFTIARLIAAGNLWLALGVAAADRPHLDAAHHAGPGAAAEQGGSPAVRLALDPAPARDDGRLHGHHPGARLGGQASEHCLRLSRVAARPGAPHGRDRRRCHTHCGRDRSLDQRTDQHRKPGRASESLVYLVGGQPPGVPGRDHQPVDVRDLFPTGTAGSGA